MLFDVDPLNLHYMTLKMLITLFILNKNNRQQLKTIQFQEQFSVQLYTHNCVSLTGNAFEFWPAMRYACIILNSYIMVSGLNMSSEWSIDILLFPVELSVDLHIADSCFLASGKYKGMYSI